MSIRRAYCGFVPRKFSLLFNLLISKLVVQADSLMTLVFPVARILQKLWGGPPGLHGSPWTRSSQRDHSHPNGKAGQGAVRGPGGAAPQFLQTVRSREKRAAWG